MYSRFPDGTKSSASVVNWPQLPHLNNLNKVLFGSEWQNRCQAGSLCQSSASMLLPPHSFQSFNSTAGEGEVSIYSRKLSRVRQVAILGGGLATFFLLAFISGRISAKGDWVAFMVKEWCSIYWCFCLNICWWISTSSMNTRYLIHYTLTPENI